MTIGIIAVTGTLDIAARTSTCTDRSTTTVPVTILILISTSRSRNDAVTVFITGISTNFDVLPYRNSSYTARSLLGTTRLGAHTAYAGKTGRTAFGSTVLAQRTRLIDFTVTVIIYMVATDISLTARSYIGLTSSPTMHTAGLGTCATYPGKTGRTALGSA